MSFNKNVFDLFWKSKDFLEIPYENIKVCILGDLFIKKDLRRFFIMNKVLLYHTALEFFKYQGVDCISIDINGKHKSLPLDLGKPINNIKNFDIIINGGTTEHVYDQYNCFRNIHNFCKLWGIVVFVGPLEGYWNTHSKWKYKQEFFDCFCFLNNYEILYHYNVKVKTNFCVYISYIKTQETFISKKMFVKIWNKYHKERMNDE